MTGTWDGSKHFMMNAPPPEEEGFTVASVAKENRGVNIGLDQLQTADLTQRIQLEMKPFIVGTAPGAGLFTAPNICSCVPSTECMGSSGWMNTALASVWMRGEVALDGSTGLLHAAAGLLGGQPLMDGLVAAFTPSMWSNDLRGKRDTGHARLHGVEPRCPEHAPGTVPTGKRATWAQHARNAGSGSPTRPQGCAESPVEQVAIAPAMGGIPAHGPVLHHKDNHVFDLGCGVGQTGSQEKRGETEGVTTHGGNRRGAGLRHPPHTPHPTAPVGE